MKFDEDLAAQAKGDPCGRCGGRLHKDAFARKPRIAKGIELPKGYDKRFSFTCRKCRKRHTPPSARYLGRRVYLGVVVVLATAMQQGLAPWRLRRLREELGVSRQTLERWRTWWAEAFTGSGFWKAAKAALSTPVTGEIPRSLVERFAGDDVGRLAAVSRFMSPLSTPADYVPDRRG